MNTEGKPSQLRSLLRPYILALKDAGGHKDLADLCRDLGMPDPPPQLPGNLSKADRMRASFEAADERNLPNIAERYIACRGPSPQDRNKIQDMAWLGMGPEISKKCRREIAAAINRDKLFGDADNFDKLIDSLFLLDDTYISKLHRSLRAAIQQHVHKNPDDWTVAEIFGNLGAFDCPSRRFSLFIEGLVSSDVQPDEATQRELATAIAGCLRPYGLDLREVDVAQGYPVYQVVVASTTVGAVKQVIFGCSQKPDLRLRDLVSNDIEIVTNSDKYLVYDRVIGASGLRVQDLLGWWAEKVKLKDEKAIRTTLYERLMSSLPQNSPPQQLVLETYAHKISKGNPHFPALLPEVWLHWDHKTVKERGFDALKRLRMDFLLLLPSAVRVVIEVDGIQHYSDGDGRASPKQYAHMVSADREAQLAGYKVFHFGGAELEGAKGVKILQTFFAQLFSQHGIA